MIIYPAIDIKDGRVVRLRQGDPNQKTVYSDSPLEVAKRWQDAGAAWLHIVNLDGAFNQQADLFPVLRQIANRDMNIQFGGGLRSAESVQVAIDGGVTRVVLGTLAVKNPDLIGELIEKHGAEHIAVALDAKNGRVATHGWQQESEWTAVDLGNLMVAKGVRHALYTDITRDGELEGVNVEATRHLARETGLQVIASGGVRSIEDVHALAGTEVAGVILGKALYEGMIDLAEALSV
jgi:phosphoribosylformimino-5-aminoimidazole carboxamide ribotide isomerase